MAAIVPTPNGPDPAWDNFVKQQAANPAAVKSAPQPQPSVPDPGWDNFVKQQADTAAANGEAPLQANGTEDYRNASLGHTLLGSAENIPSNAYDVGAGLYNMVRHPISTGEGVYDAAKTVLPFAGHAISGGIGQLVGGNVTGEDADASDKVAKYFTSGDYKNTLAYHPVDIGLALAPFVGQAGAAADAALTGGRLASVAGKIGDAAAAAPGAAIKGAAKLFPGINSEEFDFAQNALSHPDPNVAANFKAGMSGGISQAEVANGAQILSNLRATRSQQYLSGMAQQAAQSGVSGPIDWSGLQQALKQAYNDHWLVPKTGTYQTPGIDSVLPQAEKLIEDHINSPDPVAHNIYGGDALKQNLAYLARGAPSPATQKAIDDLRRAASAAIQQRYPGYSDVMDSYGEASDAIKSAAVSMGQNAKSPVAALNKLAQMTKTPGGQMVMRDLWQTNPEFIAKLTGNAFHGWVPGGIHGGELSVSNLMAAALNGANIGTAAAVGANTAIHSPRMWGYGLQAAQGLKNGLGAVGNAAGKIPGAGLVGAGVNAIGAPRAVEGLSQMGRQGEQPEDDNGYAKGGKVGGKASRVNMAQRDKLVKRLLALADKAKKDEKNVTKPLLNAPDYAIIKALSIAKQAI